jgi:hypothetical protein
MFLNFFTLQIILASTSLAIWIAVDSTVVTWIGVVVGCANLAIDGCPHLAGCKHR